ncbi:hypothetical protein [Ammoniphilus sp. YIM 78166]|uniref:hypothetical protein n=1 Tax=Ammoniphilus sp. YIM 78166 TaxID=1644106 RepID=UPI00106F1E36|nr:hypothetical protein [Ammoniphilus sp. YIM 78166]
MTYSIYSSIGSTFGKLLRAKPKPIIVTKTLSQRNIPFLQGFKPGSTSLRALEDGIIDEIAEDIFETIFTLSLEHRGLQYVVTVGEAKDCWILKDIRPVSRPAAAAPPSSSNKKRKPLLTLSFFVLILVSVGGYILEFGLNKSSEPSSNLSVFEAYTSGEQEQSPVAESVADAEPKEEDKRASQWEEEKAELEAKIASLLQENEELKRQLATATLFVIEPGMDLLQIAQAAEQAGLVTSAQEFNEAMIRLGAKEHLSPGTYLVVPGSTYEVLIEKFTKGVVKK